VHLTPTHQALEQHTVLAGFPCRRHNTLMSSMPRCRPPERPPWARGRRPPYRPTTTAAASTQHVGAGAHMPPPRPDAAAQIGPDWALLPCATTTPEPRRPPQPRSRAHHPAATRPPIAAGNRSRRPGHGPSRRGAARVRETPPPSSAARALPGHVLRRRRGREGREAGRWRRLGFDLLCCPSGGDTGGRVSLVKANESLF
jgi:hypothetical protein